MQASAKNKMHYILLMVVVESLVRILSLRALTALVLHSVASRAADLFLLRCGLSQRATSNLPSRNSVLFGRLKQAQSSDCWAVKLLPSLVRQQLAIAFGIRLDLRVECTGADEGRVRALLREMHDDLR